MKGLLSKYTNGNTEVSIFNDGTKIREYHGVPTFEFPESMDIKITNYCDLSNYCKWCHEDSNEKGGHADLDKILLSLKGLPPGVELAIGGGNPLEHPDLEVFLMKVKDMGLIPNLTINQLHVRRYLPKIERIIFLLGGLGITYNGVHIEETRKLQTMNHNVVYHLVMGVNTLSEIRDIQNQTNYFCKILILGYKKFKKGGDHFSKEVEDNIEQWYMRLPMYFGKDSLKISRTTDIFAFDNLAIKQLNLKRFFTEISWDKFFMGDDGSHTFYIDGPNQKFGKNSTSEKKYDMKNMDVKSMFNIIKENNG